MSYDELLEVSECKDYVYEEYIQSQPMRDGEEICAFLDELDAESEVKECK